MFGRLLILFLTVPIFELFLLLWIGERIGLLPTLALIVVTALIGSWLARREGVATYNRVQEEMRRGRVPGNALLDGLVILISGALLLTPGILTDLVGFAGLIPVTRKRIGSALRKQLSSSIRRPGSNGHRPVGNVPPPPFSRSTKPPDNEDGTGVVVE